MIVKFKYRRHEENSNNKRCLNNSNSFLFINNNKLINK